MEREQGPPSDRAGVALVNSAADRDDLATAGPDRVIERALASAREILGMDMSYVADTRRGTQSYIAVDGDGASFGAQAGEEVPLEGTYCEALLDGRLDNIVSDSQTHGLVCALPITAEGRIGAYIGVPLVFSDGRVLGTFCCLSHAADPALHERDVRMLEVFGRLIADQLEAEERAAESRRLQLVNGKVTALLAALELRDGYTESHSIAVVELTVAVGRELGLSDAVLCELEQAALLHDIGKIGVPDRVLTKAGPLDVDEWTEMRRHPELGERIVASMPALAHLAPILRSEHERWDGRGYPDGLAGEEILRLSRIVFACDAYHAMTSDRPYRRAMPVAEARGELRENAGRQFDPNVVPALNGVLSGGEAETGFPADWVTR